MKIIICLSVISFASLCVSSKSISQATARIVGGEDADIEDYPYQVSVLLEGTHRCGGSIIGELFILTARHCTEGQEEKSVTIRIGSSLINEGGKVYNTAKIYNFPDDENDYYDNDIAILKLNKKIQFGVRAQPVLVNKNEEVKDGWMAVATGWGTKKSNGPVSVQLQKVYLPVISTEKCKQFHPKEGDIEDNVFCAGYIEGGKDTCQGDSGGPLVIGGVLIGIVSWGDRCAEPDSPGVYTKVSAYKDFIEKIIRGT